MTYEIRLTREAEADIRRLDPVIARRVISKLQWLAHRNGQARSIVSSLAGGVQAPRGRLPCPNTLETPSRRIVVHFARNRREVYKL